MRHCILLIVCLLLAANPTATAQKADKKKEIEARLKAHRAQKLKRGNILSKADTIEVGLLNDLAYLHYTRSENWLPYAREGYELAKKIQDTRGIANCSNLMGVHYLMVGDYANAEKCLRITIDASRKVGDIVSQIHALINLGSMYGRMSKYNEALKTLFQGLDLAKKENEYEAIVGAYNNIGAVYKGLGNIAEARKNYKACLKLQQKRKDDFTACVTLQNLGEIFADEKNPDEAMRYFKEGYRLARQGRNKDSESNNLAGIGRVHEALGDKEKALASQLEALAIRESIGDMYGISHSKSLIGKLLLSEGRTAEALRYATESMANATELNQPELKAQAAELLSNIYRQLGDYRQAYENHQVFKSMNDSLFNMERDKKITELRLNYEFKQKQDAMQARQQKKDAETQEKAKKQRTTMYFILMALLLVVVFSFYVVNDLKKTRQQRRIIEDQKGQIQESLTEKETLLREIHHRVKNNLQIISSLLNIQSDSIQDQSILSSLQEGQSRVQAMSLIHQNLYQSEKVNNVAIDNYLRELVAYLGSMFHSEGRSVAVDIRSGGIEFDIDTAIPLGLIVNELVSNAYKYAFGDQREGSIVITIVRHGETEFELTVTNDGARLPDGFDVKQHKSMGLKLVSILSRQLRGSFSVVPDAAYTIFSVRFRDMKTLRAA